MNRQSAGRTGHTVKGFLITLTLGTGVVAPAIGQDLPTLTLQEAIDIAHRRNPEYLSSLAQADASGAAVRSRYGSFFPSLSGFVGWGGRSDTRLSAENEFGEAVILDNPITFKSSNASQGFQSSLTLFDGLGNVNRLAAAKHYIFR